MKKKLLLGLALFPAVGFTALAVYGFVKGLTLEVHLLVIAIPIWYIAGMLAYDKEK